MPGFTAQEVRTLKQLHLLYKDSYPTKSLSYLERYTMLNDSIYKSDMAKETARYQNRYETHERETKIKLQAEYLKHTNMRLYFSLAVALMSVALCVILFRAIRYRRKQNEHLKKINAAKDKLFSIISHDLKRPAADLKFSAQTLAQTFSSLSNEDAEQQLNEISQLANGQSELLQNLLEWTRMQTGNKKVHRLAQTNGTKQKGGD